MTHKLPSEKSSNKEVDFSDHPEVGKLILYSVGKGEPLKSPQEWKGSHPELGFIKIT